MAAPSLNSIDIDSKVLGRYQERQRDDPRAARSLISEVVAHRKLIWVGKAVVCLKTAL
jgi:hypothetical protein